MEFHNTDGKNYRHNADSTNEFWKKKYEDLLYLIPFALIEVKDTEIIYLSQKAKQLLEIEPGVTRINLSELITQPEDLIKEQQKPREFRIRNKTLVLKHIIAYSATEHVYRVDELYPGQKDIPDHKIPVFTTDTFRDFVEQSDLGICIFNEEGIIIEWNRNMSVLYEVERDVYLNRPLWEFDFDYLPPRRKTKSEKKQLREAIIRYLNKPEKILFKGEFEKEIHGNIKFVQYYVFPIQTNAGYLFGRINIDISEKKASELELLEYKEHLEKLVERKTLELRQNEASMRLLLQSIPMAYYSYDPADRSKIWYNDQITALTGYKADDFRKNPGLWVQRIHPDDYNRLKGTFEKLSFVDQRVSCEYRWYDAMDQEIWIYDQAVLIEATDLHPRQIVGCFMDISDRKETESAIIESEHNYREIFNNASDAIIILNPKTSEIEDVNDTMLALFKTTYRRALTSDLNWFSAQTPPYDAAHAMKMIEKVLIGDPEIFEWLARTENGDLFWIEVNLKMVIINGEAKLMAIVRDIDEKKKAAEILQKSEEKYRILIEGQTDLIIKIDTEGRFLFVSPSYCEMFGTSEKELLGNKFLPQVHEQDRESTLNSMKKLYEPPYTCYIEQRAFTRHGWRWLAWSDKSILNENNEVYEIIGVGRDITYQKDVEEALRRGEDRFRSIVQQLSDIVFIIDTNSCILYDTPSIKRILGYNEGSLAGNSIYEIISSDDADHIHQKIDWLKSEKERSITTEAQVKKVDGEYIPAELVFINLLDLPAIEGIVLTLRDISERKLLDKKILDAVIKTEEQERERFAKNLHDDLGPLLSSIKMYIGSMKTTKDPVKQEYITEQLNEIVKEAIDTTKEVSNDLSPHILINYGLVSAIENFIRKIPPTIRVEFHSSLPSDRYSNTIENSFYRIIKELINNTLKHSGADKIDISLTEKGQHLFLTYSDNGKGFNPDHQGKSKGMGISNIISRAKSLNATYELTSGIKKGFSFQISIPIQQSLE